MLPFLFLLSNDDPKNNYYQKTLLFNALASVLLNVMSSMLRSRPSYSKGCEIAHLQHLSVNYNH